MRLDSSFWATKHFLWESSSVVGTHSVALIFKEAFDVGNTCSHEHLFTARTQETLETLPLTKRQATPRLRMPLEVEVSSVVFAY
jgi:hypothetical protein